MEIKTKFNLNQEVWYMDNNQVLSSQVQSMEIYCTQVRHNDSVIASPIEIRCSLSNSLYTVSESKLFASKQELLNSL